MSDPLNILGSLEEPRRFEEAVRTAVERLHSAAGRFEALYQDLPDAKLTDHEWAIVERAAEELSEAVERAEDGYVAAQYDSHAWYRIMENLDKINLRLESAIGLMDHARQRPDQAPGVK